MALISKFGSASIAIVCLATPLLLGCVDANYQGSVATDNVNTASVDARPISTAHGNIDNPAALILANSTFPEPLSVGGTVDSGPDDGFLSCARSISTGAHTNTTQAINNLLSAPADPQAVIVGHGGEGHFRTGGGQQEDIALDQFVASKNTSSWAGEFKKLKDSPYSVLTVVSCETGAGQTGAELLYQLATIMNKTVRARTGLTTCVKLIRPLGELRSHYNYEDGSTWQVATPASRPAPIQAPHGPKAFESANFTVSTTYNKVKTFPANALKSVAISRSASEKKSGFLILERDEARSLAMLIDFNNPIRLEGALAAIPTREIRLKFEDAGNVLQKTYRVYNDSIAQDIELPEMYYRIGSRFKDMFLMLTNGNRDRRSK